MVAKITYHIVEHDGGWAYQADGVFSETFPSHDAALAAARRAAGEQRVGEEGSVGITWEGADGRWREEIASGHDRPETEVEG